jgi:hypothetical protein
VNRQVFSENGKWLRKFGSTDLSDTLKCPTGIAFDCAGNLFVCETLNNRLQVFKRDGTQLWTFGDGQFTEPRGVCVSENGLIFVADTGNHRVCVFSI